MKHIINLGAGVQSSTMSLMAARGEIEPMPDFAIFADTHAEPQSVYRWLDWLEKQLPFPVHRVTAGRLRDKATTMKRTEDGRTFSQTAIPVFTLNEDGSQGRITHRTCTRDFKIRPIHKFLRNRYDIAREYRQIRKKIREEHGQMMSSEREAYVRALWSYGPIVKQWMGISLDELGRMRRSRDWWSELRYPLIEKRITRQMCLDWMREHGYPEPPRSACNFCPFHGRAEWKRLKDEEPEAFADAVEFERQLQEIKAASDNFKSKPFLHRSLVPLDQVDFRSDYDKGQLSLWQDECEGMCGV